MSRNPSAAAMETRGTCDPRFSAVREAFAENFRSRDEVGATVAVTLDGRTVVDLWGGFLDADRQRPWRRDTLVCMMSVAKAVTATCAHVLVDRGTLDVDAPVARYWPEFAANGKERLPVRYILDHRAGLPAIDRVMPAGAAFDWEAMTAALAAQRPMWEPGARLVYHSVTMGYLVGEVIRRISGKGVGTFLEEEICGPLGLDYHIGLAEDHHARCADFFGDIRGTLFDDSDPRSLMARAMAQVPASVIATPAFRRAEIPSINGYGTARSVARLFGVLACGGELDGTRLMSAETIDKAIAEQWAGMEDRGRELRMGLGYMLGLPSAVAMGRNPRAFGHTGAGGAIGFADPDARIGFAYGMNRMYSGAGISPRLQVLVDATFSAL